MLICSKYRFFLISIIVDYLLFRSQLIQQSNSKFLLVDFEVTLYNSVESLKLFLYSYLVLVSSRSVKTRELSFAQFVYILRKVCIFFNF